MTFPWSTFGLELALGINQAGLSRSEATTFETSILIVEFGVMLQSTWGQSYILIYAQKVEVNFQHLYYTPGKASADMKQRWHMAVATCSLCRRNSQKTGQNLTRAFLLKSSK